jgi:hypothetical protein
VLAESGWADVKLLGKKDAAYAILHQVAVDLGPKVRSRVAQPFEDLQPSFVRQRLQGDINLHI